MSVANKLQPITEASCLVNVMHEILIHRWNQKIPSIAVCPTQHLEKYVGYDVALPGFDKVLALQFKAYKRYNHKARDYFATYRSQHKTLIKYPRNCAFYVFPDYRTHLQMNRDRFLELKGRPFRILNNTWFVEVHSVPWGTRKVTRTDLIRRKIPHIRWLMLSRMIRKCSAGFRIVRIQDHYVLMDPEEKEVEVLEIPSGRFSFFYTNLLFSKLQQKQKEKVVFT